MSCGMKHIVELIDIVKYSIGAKKFYNCPTGQIAVLLIAFHAEHGKLITISVPIKI